MSALVYRWVGFAFSGLLFLASCSDEGQLPVGSTPPLVPEEVQLELEIKGHEDAMDKMLRGELAGDLQFWPFRADIEQRDSQSLRRRLSIVESFIDQMLVIKRREIREHGSDEARVDLLVSMFPQMVLPAAASRDFKLANVQREIDPSGMVVDWGDISSIEERADRAQYRALSEKRLASNLLERAKLAVVGLRHADGSFERIGISHTVLVRYSITGEPIGRTDRK